MQPGTGTTELVLPGLEAAAVTESRPGHWIERGPQKRLMVFAGRSHPDLASRHHSAAHLKSDASSLAQCSQPAAQQLGQDRGHCNRHSQQEHLPGSH